MLGTIDKADLQATQTDTSKLVSFIFHFFLKQVASPFLPYKYCMSPWAKGLNGGLKTKQGSKLIHYKMQRTDQKLTARVGIEPGPI